MAETATEALLAEGGAKGVKLPGVPGVTLFDDKGKGEYKIEFDKPRLAMPIIISKNSFYLENGKKVFYKNPDTGESEEIVIDAPTTVFDLTTAEGAAKATFIRKFDIVKKLRSKVKITDTNKKAKEHVATKDKEYEVVDLVRPYLSDKVKLQALALNLGGIEIKGVDPDVVKDAIYERIAKDPESIRKAVSDPDFTIKAMVLLASKKVKADSKETVVEDRQGAFYYGQHYLGKDLQSAVAWCRENTQEYHRIVGDLK